MRPKFASLTPPLPALGRNTHAATAPHTGCATACPPLRGCCGQVERKPSICSCKLGGILCHIGSRMKSMPSRRACFAAGTKSASPANNTIYAIVKENSIQFASFLSCLLPCRAFVVSSAVSTNRSRCQMSTCPSVRAFGSAARVVRVVRLNGAKAFDEESPVNQDRCWHSRPVF